MFAMRELSGPLSLLIEMVTYSSYCNESFSLGVLQLLKVKGRSDATQSWQMRVVMRVLIWFLCLLDPAGDGSSSWTEEHFSNAAGAAGEWQPQAPSPTPHRLDFNDINSLFQVMEDPLQSQRLKYAFESEKGLLGASQCKAKAV